jgi:hypothetical protein
MHTSWLVFGMWLASIGFAIVAQTANYLSSTRKDLTCLRHWGFGLGVLATLLAGGAAFKAAIDWSALPIDGNLRPGQLYDNGGEPAIVETPERLELFNSRHSGGPAPPAANR